jgi:GAF domain-containing protein
MNVPITRARRTLATSSFLPGGGNPPDQLDVVYAVVERVALSLENARLFEDANRRAQRERLVTEISTKIRKSNDPQEMIKTAVAELRQALGVSRVEVIPQEQPAAAAREQQEPQA